MKKIRSALGTVSLRGDDAAREDVAVAVDFGAEAPVVFAVAAQAAAANLKARAQAFLEAFFLKVRPMAAWLRRRFSDLGGERGVGLGKFSQRRSAGFW